MSGCNTLLLSIALSIIIPSAHAQQGRGTVLGNVTDTIVNPPTYTFGNIGRALPDVRNPGFFNCDFSISKSAVIKERLKVQLRLEAFNLDNHVNLGYPNATFSAGANGLNQSSTFGTITSARQPRLIQLGLKLNC